MGKLVKWLALILLGVLLIVAIGAGILLVALSTKTGSSKNSPRLPTSLPAAHWQ